MSFSFTTEQRQTLTWLPFGLSLMTLLMALLVPAPMPLIVLLVALMHLRSNYLKSSFHNQS